MRPQREAQLLRVLDRKYAYDDYDAYEKRREAIDRLAEANKLVSDAGLKQRFYELATDDQIAALVFVTPQTCARARRRGLI